MIAFLKDLVCKDFWLKLFSLVLAVLFWFTVNGAIQNDVSPGTSLTLGTVETRTFANLPVLVMSSAADVRSVHVHPSAVEVTVQGDAKTLRKLQAKDIRVLVDLTGIEAAHDLRKRIEVSTPTGVTYVRVDPEEVEIIYPPNS